MRFFAHHGCFGEEKTIGNYFIVDFAAETDMTAASESDSLDDALNYQIQSSGACCRPDTQAFPQGVPGDSKCVGVHIQAQSPFGRGGRSVKSDDGPMTMRVAVHTLGCKLNYAESSTVAREFARRGYQ